MRTRLTDVVVALCMLSTNVSVSQQNTQKAINYSQFTEINNINESESEILRNVIYNTK